MKDKFGIKVFAAAEILIGIVTLVAVAASIIEATSRKPTEVIVFVLISAAISIYLGFGILRHNFVCYYLLLYFTSIIILSKILIFAKIITLSGALETSIPSDLKNLISIFYHGSLIFYFMRLPVRNIFIKNNPAVK